MTNLNMSTETNKPHVAPVPGEPGKVENAKPGAANDPKAPASATPKP